MQRPTGLLLAAIAALAALGALSPTPSRASGGESLRWRFEKGTGYVYRLGGPDGARVLFDELLERALFSADFPDGRTLACPADRVQDLIFTYALALPEAPAEPGAFSPVHDVHSDLPSSIGPIAADGERRCVGKKGAAYELRTAVELTPGPGAPREARFERGALTVAAVFHQKKGALASAEFALEWSERQPSGPPKKTAVRGTLELVRACEADPRKLRQATDQAIRRGVEVLKPYLQRAEYRRGPYPLGHLALAIFALEKAGLAPGDPLLRVGFEEMDRFPPLAQAPAGAAPPETYSVALAILALEGKAIRRAHERPGATRIRYEQGDLDAADRDRIGRLVRWLVDARPPGRGVWGYRSFADREAHERAGDMSNTQFAVLALHAASRAGVKVAPEVFAAIARDVMAAQEPHGPEVRPALDLEAGAWLESGAAGDGTGEREEPLRPARGTFYGLDPRVNDRPYASVTAAAVSSLLVCREELARAKALEPALGARMEAAIRDGLAWLQRHHTMHANWPDYTGWPLYHLYSLEKAFEIGRIERIGGHDWWSEGATEVLIRERTSGAWPAKAAGAAPAAEKAGWGSIDATAMAILFLTRASAEPEVDVRQPGRERTGGGTVDAAGRGGAGDDPLSVVVAGLGRVNAREAVAGTEVRDADVRRERIDLAEKAVAAVDEEAKPLLAPALGKLLDSPYPECARLAAKLLRAIAGERIADRAAADAFFAKWDEARRLGASDDPEVIPVLRAGLKDPLPAVRRAALVGLARLRAVEAIPDLIDALGREDAELAAYGRHVLADLLGRDAGFDETDRAGSLERWRRLWAQSSGELLRREEIRRAIRALAIPGRREAARRRLVAIGRPAARALIDALRSDDLRDEAAGVLAEISGRADLGADRDAWEKWLEEK